MKQTLFNPFIQVAGLKALVFGLILMIASVLLGWMFNTNFDGALDIHFGGSSDLVRHFNYSAINIFSLICIFYLISAILTKGKTRLIDIAGTMTLARFPFLIAPFLNIGDINSLIGEKILYGVYANMGKDMVEAGHFSCNPCTVTTMEYVYLIFSMIVTLFIIVWFVILLFNAYKISTNLKGAKVIVSFIAGLVLAEVCSSILIHYIL